MVSEGRLTVLSLTSSSSVSVTGGTLQMTAGGGNKLIKTPSVAVTGSGRIDLTDHKLIVTTPGATGSWNGSVYTGLTGLIQSGRNGGNWAGAGIVTSQSSAAVTGLTSIGIATAAQVKNIASTATAVWAGQTVSGSDTLVMYTYAGDSNLDGIVSGDDYSAIDFSILVPGSSGWVNGDFNYDGAVTGDDYSAIDFAILAQGAPFPTGGAATGGLAVTATVPEPTALGVLLAADVTTLLCRQRRRRRC
jgi:hypothetical protein